MSDTKVQLDVKIFSQDFKNSCWLAGYQMLLSYEGRKHSESDIQEAFKQAGLNFKDALRYGLNESLLKSACAAGGLRTGGVLPFGTGKADQGASRSCINGSSTVGRCGWPVHGRGSVTSTSSAVRTPSISSCAASIRIMGSARAKRGG